MTKKDVMKLLITTLAILITTILHGQDAIVLSASNDTVIGVISSTTINHIIIDARKVETRQVSSMKVGGDWYSPAEWLSHQGGSITQDLRPLAPLRPSPFQDSAELLKRAGNQGTAGICVLVGASLIGVIVGGDTGLIIGGSGAVVGTFLQLSAWTNTKNAGKKLQYMP